MSEDNNSHYICSICYCGYDEGDDERCLLLCNHAFHLGCVLNLQQPSCPLCRQPIKPCDKLTEKDITNMVGMDSSEETIPFVDTSSESGAHDSWYVTREMRLQEIYKELCSLGVEVTFDSASDKRTDDSGTHSPTNYTCDTNSEQSTDTESEAPDEKDELQFFSDDFEDEFSEDEVSNYPLGFYRFVEIGDKDYAKYGAPGMYRIFGTRENPLYYVRVTVDGRPLGPPIIPQDVDNFE